MDEHISVLRDACHGYKEAVEAVLAKRCAAKSSAAGATNHRIENINLAMANLKRARERFISESRKAREFFNMTMKEWQAVLESKGVDPNAAKTTTPDKPNDAQMRDHSVLLENRQRDLDSEARYVSKEGNTIPSLADLDLYKAELEEMLDPDPAHVRPNDAQQRDYLDLLVKDQTDLDSEARYGDAADVSEESNTVLSQALADLGLYSAEHEEIAEHNQDIPDLDPNKQV